MTSAVRIEHRQGRGNSARLCRRLARLVLAGTVLAAATTAGTASAVASSGGPLAVPPSQDLAMLLEAHTAMARPSGRAAQVALVPARTPITGVQTVLPVVGRTMSSEGVRWLQVKLPGRPNGHTGWIRKRATVGSRTSWHIVVDISSRRTTVYNRGGPVRRFSAVVGKPSTPTPRGRFFVEEAVRLQPSDSGAPFALALSARSAVYQEFAGGPGQVALHGLANVGGVLGTAVSHGCVRLDGSAMRWLVVRIGPGTPVTITG